MAIAIIFPIMTVFLVFLYRRYVPVRGVSEIKLNQAVTCRRKVSIVDTRDYQTSASDAVDRAFCLPLAYLNRHFREIPEKDVIIVASDHVEKNLSTRLLRRKGLQVVGYCVMN